MRCIEAHESDGSSLEQRRQAESITQNIVPIKQISRFASCQSAILQPICSSAAWFGKGHSEKCSAVHSLAIAGSESIPLPVEDSDRCAVYVDCAGQGLVALPGAGERHYVPIHCSWHQGHIGGALCSCCCLCLDVFGWKIYALGYIVSRLLIILFRMCACVHYLRYRSITKELRLHSHTFHTQ